MHGGIYRCTGIYFFKSANIHIRSRSMVPCGISDLKIPGHRVLQIFSEISDCF